jgi:hypothetical protein
MLSLFKKFVVNNYLTVKILLFNNQQRDIKKEFYSTIGWLILKYYSNFLINLLKTYRIRTSINNDHQIQRKNMHYYFPQYPKTLSKQGLLSRACNATLTVDVYMEVKLVLLCNWWYSSILSLKIFSKSWFSIVFGARLTVWFTWNLALCLWLWFSCTILWK